MGVVADRETEMPFDLLSGQVERIFPPAQQLDDGQRQIGEARRIGPATPRKEIVERERRGILWKGIAKLCRQRDDSGPVLGSPQHPAQRGQALAREEAGGYAVGRDHEILDEFMGSVLLTWTQVAQHLSVEHRLSLHCLQSECTMCVAHASERLRDLILNAQLLVHAW